VKIEWTPLALQDRIEIFEFIASDSVTSAGRVDDAFDSQVEQLIEHPNSGRAGRLAGTRELVVSQLPYIIVYKVAKESVLVLRVMHTARDWPT
jgi:addiction module RelE/StbE family toxin